MSRLKKSLLHKKQNKLLKQSQKIQSKKLFLQLSTKRFWSIIAGIVVILGLYQLWPSISATVGIPLNTSEPYSAPFLIKNESIYPIKIISVSVFTKNLKVKSNVIKNLEINDTSFNRTILKTLDQHKSLHILSNVLGNIPVYFVSSADIKVSVLFKPIFINLTFQDDFDYTFYISDNGSIKWYPN